MKKLLLAVIVTAGPAVAQTTVRVPVSGISAIPGLGASFDGARLGAAPLLMPTLTPGMQMPALSALALIPTLTPTLVQPALATNILAAAAKPVEGSPLGVIRDASANEARKTAALDQLFENSAPSSPESLAVSAQSAALTPESSNEFSQAPAWFDVSKLKFAALVKAGTGGTAVMRYGWRNQFEMSVFVFPGSASVSFKEYSANPMGKPKQSLEASLQKAPSRAAAAKILRAVQARNPVSGKDKATLDAMLTLLSTLVHEPPPYAAAAAASLPPGTPNQTALAKLRVIHGLFEDFNLRVKFGPGMTVTDARSVFQRLALQEISLHTAGSGFILMAGKSTAHEAARLALVLASEPEVTQVELTGEVRDLVSAVAAVEASAPIWMPHHAKIMSNGRTWYSDNVILVKFAEGTSEESIQTTFRRFGRDGWAFRQDGGMYAIIAGSGKEEAYRLAVNLEQDATIAAIKVHPNVIKASAKAPSRGRTQDNRIAFDFSSLDPTSRYFLGTYPVQIQSLGGQAIEMTVFRNHEFYIVRYENGKGVKVLKNGLLQMSTQPALRGLQEMLMLWVEDNKPRETLFARMLEEIRATLAPAYVPGTTDPLWRYLWAFKYRSVNPTVAYYAGYRTDTVATPRNGEIEMVLRKDASKIILTWRADTGFKVKLHDVVVFSPNVSDLRGMQLSLMKEMLETGSRGPLTSKLLQKFQDAVGD